MPDTIFLAELSWSEAGRRIRTGAAVFFKNCNDLYLTVAAEAPIEFQTL